MCAPLSFKSGDCLIQLLVWLENASHIVTPSDVDELISSELPDRGADPFLYQTVTSTITHGPCGPNLPNSPYWDSEKQGTKDVEIDHRYVVPRRDDCYINVKTCCGICAIKYILKYVYKGHDRASIELRRRVLYVHNRILGKKEAVQMKLKFSWTLDGCPAHEGIWRIYRCRLHRQQPSIIRLQVHFEGQQMITFQAEESLEDVVRNRADQDTPLTGFFKLNQYVNENTHAVVNQLFYQEISNCFSWDKFLEVEKVMCRSARTARMYFEGPNGGDRCFLRPLLIVVRGPTCYQDDDPLGVWSIPLIMQHVYQEGFLKLTKDGHPVSGKLQLSRLGSS
ncbi:putative helicase-like protein [Rhizoctonia solani 123E]|uniref:Putative helicase-like protein n=1 Tax=Rhizoctonia solani 123E TaxID=1423351 RepID=A0A074RJE6_9AGAM|nr:putative helicase-like protein [Rhizoctonia solani 123E]